MDIEKDDIKICCVLKELWIRLQGHGHRGMDRTNSFTQWTSKQSRDGEKKKSLIIMIGLSEAGEVSDF